MMQFINTLLAAAIVLFSLASANSVTFVNQDATLRTIIFTAQDGLEALQDLEVQGYASATQDFPDSWIGNWYSVSEGAENVPGMLGEVTFGGYSSGTFFDISAIVNPDDNGGVKELFPKNSNLPMSGCQTFPCDNAYKTWDDVETMSTDETDLVCLIGNLNSERKRSMVARMAARVAARVGRSFAVGGQ